LVQGDFALTDKVAPYIPSGLLIRRIVNPITLALGGPTLVVRGRTSGRMIATPVPPFDFEGARYLISGGGETHWVRNLRAAGEAQMRIRGKSQPFTAVEITGTDRDRIVAAYRDKLGRRAAAYFAALPDLADHAAFRMDSPTSRRL
jgi:deazaflavin-dependent oxidoreductase (nitroreductase family)